ncbi:Flp family type IVb pilin [Bacillus sp. FJAT-27251]|uniref:Flp family type IVb pilin n=1 Tax=Bacillus sp. FJAT-27251 TaxID=1684142 RepID=UPI000840B17F|nr:Flp family type IVb pilin [Bacillus sp. FJAT-27251]
MLEKMKNLVVEEEGQAMTEYGLIIALVAVVVVGAIATIGTKLNGKFGEIVTKLG